MTLGDFERVANELIRVKEENQELKKQLEEKKDYIKKLQATKDKLDKWDYKNTLQQAKFIKYLEDEIEKKKKKTTFKSLEKNVPPVKQAFTKP